jgi:hypothetical protein
MFYLVQVTGGPQVVIIKLRGKFPNLYWVGLHIIAENDGTLEFPTQRTYQWKLA